MRLQDLRKQNKLTQKDVAEIIGCHYKSVYQIEQRFNAHLFIQYVKLLREHGADINRYLDEEVELLSHEQPDDK